MNARSSRRNAFSLIELVVVVLILGLLAAVAAPRYSNSVAQFELETQALRIAQDLQNARQRAVNLGRRVEVNFDNTAGTYQSDDGQIVGQVPDGMRLTADFDSQTTFQYDSDGTARVSGAPLTSASVRVSMANRDLTVVLDGGTGNTQVTRAEGATPQ